MKAYRNLAIIFSFFLLLFIGSFGYTIWLNQRANAQINRFANGQILYPDYAHADTLKVVDADYLNKCLNDGKLKSDGDIMEILNETTINYKP